MTKVKISYNSLTFNPLVFVFFARERKKERKSQTYRERNKGAGEEGGGGGGEGGTGISGWVNAQGLRPINKMGRCSLSILFSLSSIQKRRDTNENTMTMTAGMRKISSQAMKRRMLTCCCSSLLIMLRRNCMDWGPIVCIRIKPNHMKHLFLSSFLGYLTSQQHAKYPKDRSAQTVLSATTLRQTLQIILAVSSNPSTLTQSKPVLLLTQKCLSSGRAATRMRSLYHWHDLAEVWTLHFPHCMQIPEPLGLQWSFMLKVKNERERISFIAKSNTYILLVFLLQTPCQKTEALYWSDFCISTCQHHSVIV